MAEWERLQRLADGMRPTVRRQFLKAIESARARVRLAQVEQALADGQIARAERLLSAVLRKEDFGTVASALHDLFDKAGRATIQSLRVNTTALRFDLTNPRAIAWAEQHVGRLIVEITDGEREAIRQVIARTVRGDQSVVQAARELRSMIGLTTNQRIANINFRLGLIESGMDSRKAADKGVAYAQQQLRTRAETVARTETMQSIHSGQLEALQQMRDQGGLVGMERIWITTPDDRRCFRCLSMDGQRRGFDEPFIEPATGRAVMIPNLHPRCRCASGVVSARRGSRRVA